MRTAWQGGTTPIPTFPLARGRSLAVVMPASGGNAKGVFLPTGQGQGAWRWSCRRPRQSRREFFSPLARGKEPGGGHAGARGNPQGVFLPTGQGRGPAVAMPAPAAIRREFFPPWSGGVRGRGRVGVEACPIAFGGWEPRT